MGPRGGLMHGDDAAWSAKPRPDADAALRRSPALQAPLCGRVTVITFAMIVLSPGDPLTFLVSPERLRTADVAVLRRNTLDRPCRSSTRRR